MPLPDEPHAVLVVLHDDILLLGQHEDTASSGADEGSAIPPTRQKPEYLLTEQDCVIGRNPECTIRFKNHRTDISRRHATIKRKGAIFVLYDHSRNGTFVNHQKIDESCPLYSDDILSFASTTEMLRFKELVQGAQAVSLTKREHEVLCLMAAGQQNKQIAAELIISQETVKIHVHHIYDKLKVNNRVTAIARARILGLLKHCSVQ